MNQTKKWASILASILLAAMLGACSPAGPDQGQAYPAPVFATEDPFFEVPRVSLEDSKAAFDSRTAVFVDTRSKVSYDESHIPGAISIPANEIESRLGELDPNQWIITYCT